MRPNRPRIIFGRRPADGVERAGEVGCEHVVPVLVAHAHQQAVAGDAGVVHEQLDRPERALDLGERVVDGVGVGDVGLDRERLAARGLDRGLGLLGAVVVGRVAERDPMAGRRRARRRRRVRCPSTRR